MKAKIEIDNKKYNLEIIKKFSETDLPKLVIVSYQPNKTASEICRTNINAIKRFTPKGKYELWVVDNNSPKENIRWMEQLDEVNIIFNRTNPVPIEGRGFLKKVRNLKEPFKWGSYANGVALEIAANLVSPDTKYFMTLHMDTMPCRENWLEFLLSKIDENVKASGVRMDNARVKEGILHVLGYIIDFQLYKSLKLSFLPQLPEYDTGDLAIYNLRKAGYDIYACKNTLWQSELIDIIKEPEIKDLNVDRSFDDDGNVIFMHLGRGIRKSSNGIYQTTSVEDWVHFAKKIL